MKLFNSTVFLLIIFFLTSISNGMIIPRQDECGRCRPVIYFIFLYLLRGIRLLINIINVTKQVPIFDAFREQYVVWALPALRLNSVEVENFQNNNKAIIYYLLILNLKHIHIIIFLIKILHFVVISINISIAAILSKYILSFYVVFYFYFVLVNIHVH